MEFKQDICEALLPALRLTEAHSDIQALRYEVLDTGLEIVTAVWPEGKKVIDVTADSGAEMIKDIMRAIT